MNTQTKDDQTPLHFATKISRIELLKSLVSLEEIEIDMEDNDGRTPLHHAIENDCDSLVNMVLSQQEHRYHCHR